MIATPTPTKKKNAASRFRSRNGEKKERMKPVDNSDANNNSHAPSSKSNTHSSYEYTTPIRNANNANNTPKTVPITPESAFNEWADTASRDSSSFSPKSRALSPALVDALQMAARPSPPHSKNDDTSSTTNGGRSTPLPTYTSSIEAMAAHVEASHLQNKWNKNRQSKSAKKLKTPTKMSPLSAKILNKNRLRTVSSSTSLSSKSSSSDGRSTPVTSNRKLLFPRKLYTHTNNIPLKKLWLISLPILIPFMLCELGIGLLVLLSKDTVVVTKGEGAVVVELPLPDVHKDLGRVPVYSYNSIPVDFDSPSEDSMEEEAVSTNIDSSSEVYDEGHDDELYQTMLDDGFAKLRMASTTNQIQTETERKIVESHCGNVWEIANEMAIKEASSDVELSSPSSSINWKVLALDSQRCLAASGLSFLSIKDTLDISTRLVVSTKVFDRLSYVEPQDADIRGGLGTALLFQGIFHDDIEESRRLLSLATYHLKVASSLCSTSSRVDDMETAATADILTPVPSRQSEELANQNSISHTAILHNLALAYLATGNMKGAVPILLQSAAMNRERSLVGAESTKPYWNVPNDVLQLVEERALLISARPQLESNKKRKRKRIPFMSMPFDTEQMLDMGAM